MALCCFPSIRGSGQKKAQRERCCCCCRNWCKCRHQHPSAPGRRTHRVTVGIPGKTFPSQTRPWPPVVKAQASSSSSQSSNHDVLEEQTDRFTDASNGYKRQVDQAGKTVQCQSETSKKDITKVVDPDPDYTTYQVRVQVNQADDSVQCLSENSNQDITEGLVNGLNYTNSLNLRTLCVAELNQRLREACRMRALQKGTLEKLVGSLVPAFPAGNIPHICTLMPIHPALSRAQWFLEELLSRSWPPSITSYSIRVFCSSGGIPLHNDRGDTPQEQLAKATASVMGTWPDLIQHFGQPLMFPWFILKQALVLHNLPVKHPVGHVRSLWVELEPTEAQWEEPLKELNHTPELVEGPAPAPEPSPGVRVLEQCGPPALIRMPTTEPAPSPTPDYPRAVTPEALLREEKINILTFPARMVAEQLTAMDAELFKKVLPQQCLGCVWSQRAKPNHEEFVSTVRATVTQFNNVATCVITTCLGDPSMMAQDRAKVVEYWIKVAQECRSLRNFSSLHAILAALRSVAVHRLQETWGKVSRRRTVTVKKLFKEDNALCRKQFIKPSRFATMMLHLRGSRKGLHKKCVPFLGEYLTLLQRMDARRKDDLEEDKILQEIVVLQEAAKQYQIQPEEQFRAWFWALERLSENESYIRSCQLEP